ncbi:MAG: Peptidyl-prolyl cis-trans isomerase [Parcubacteria group bacterium GW2011_GWA1_40_21]|nr:MAG: Peptidyl-prolyl cis-trans isomerase [Parcubacteria group bacterium GW2011_GWA1_40_21]
MNGKTKLLFALAVFLIIGGILVFSGFGGESKDSDFSGRAADRNKPFPNKTFSGALLVTNFGEIEIQFATGTAPIAVSNFIKLANQSFYDGTLFHRVTKDFIQGGDPLTKEKDISIYGTGGPGYKFKDEVSPDDKVARGIVAMANSGHDTNGSQFFIVAVKEAPWLNGNHTIFARVARGMDVVDKISLLQTSKNNFPIKPVVLEKVVLK